MRVQTLFSIATWLMLGALLLAGDAGCNKPGAPPAGPQFLALGDSYTIGESIDASQRWPVQLVEMLRTRENLDLGKPLIIARTGWTTSDLAFALDTQNPSGPFKLVTLQIGVNNQYQ